MIEGIASTPNRMMPSGSKLPGPTINNIARNWPASGAAPHRHVRCGSRKPNSAASRQTAGMPIEKYKAESHASLLPDAVEIITHISAPPATAAINSQCCLFIRRTLIERGTLVA